MKLERSNVDFPLWRKKVDKSLFEHNGTTIPSWACEMWELPSLFQKITSKRSKESRITIRFLKKEYQGWVTVAQKGRSSPAYRLWFEEDLSLKLKYTFLMSYMRSLEQSLKDNDKQDIEKEIPFWEFLDIEFDLSKRQFHFTAHYRQEPSFPNLFARLIGSPPLQKISEELEGKDTKRIYKQDWKPREQLQYELGATNVIYMLLDTKNKLLYIGEAQNLVKRLSQEYSSIPKWEYFKYNVLPDSLSTFRVQLERMMIRDFAAILPSKRDQSCIAISDFRLANDKINK